MPLVSFYNPWKLQNLWLSDVFRRYRKEDHWQEIISSYEPGYIYLFKVNNRNIIEIYSKLAIKTAERRSVAED